MTGCVGRQGSVPTRGARPQGQGRELGRVESNAEHAGKAARTCQVRAADQLLAGREFSTFCTGRTLKIRG